MQKPKKKILVADDHGIMRDGLCALIDGTPDLTVVGTAKDAQETIRSVELLRPDLVILDPSMTLSDGAELITLARKQRSEQRILVLTFHADEQHLLAALRSGANGYVIKDDSRMEMLVAIHAVLNGKTFLSPAICARVVTGYLSGFRTSPSGMARTQSTVDSEVLSLREREVIKLIAEGYRTREIATLLSLSEKTVEKHRGNLMKKLNLRSAAAVTAYAIANGFLRP
ncbi:MAG: response regulator [Gammaproteobacteria bacterium]